MPLSIKDPDADRLARALAQRTGETLTLRERLERELRKDQSIERLIEDVMEIGRHCAALPLRDRRRPDEILAYDKNGLPAMIIGTSALVAVLDQEPEAERIVRTLASAPGIWSRWES